VEPPVACVVPDHVEAMTGWRAWALGITADGDPELRPIVYSGERWPAREVAQARCPPRAGSGHRSPEARCTCGLYVVDGLDRLPAITGRDVTVIGSASIWGRLVEHESGFRAEFAYPSRLRLVCGPCWGSGAFDPGVVRVQRTGRGTILALCERHARNAGVTDVTPDRLQQRLLTTYAVDPMPDEAVRAVASTWKRPRRRARTPAASAISLALVVLFFGSFLGLVVLAMSVR
jgi:hypothetical protein